MRKRFMGLGLALLLTLASSMTAGAEELQGESGWQVSFNGKKMESNFTSAGMADEINAMQPGDSVELTVTLKNDFSGQADWYMKNEVLQALEDAGDAEGGAYDYLLTYTDVTGTVTTLYSSEKFGGEGRYNGVGLHGATTTLDDFFYLDRLAKGEGGTVTLEISLDGESPGNIYQDTLATLKMNFAAEKASGDGTPGPPGSSVHLTNQVQTGDIWTGGALIALVAGIILLIIGLVAMKKKEADAA